MATLVVVRDPDPDTAEQGREIVGRLEGEAIHAQQLAAISPGLECRCHE
jgi:hypothetical protein